MSNQDLNKMVMKRVMLVHTARKVLNPIGLKIVSLVVLAGALSWFVSVSNVAKNFVNTMYDATSVYNFMTSAFLNTGHVVQVLSVALAAVALFFVRDLLRTFSYSRSNYLSKTV